MGKTFVFITRAWPSGSRSKYCLGLNDIIAFPDAAHMPVFPPDEGESWILLLDGQLGLQIEDPGTIGGD
jgi:hypothetical protein